ncbi:MAG: hypothetical protein NTV24_01285 [Candidatus Woesebacteria bacterium]|nr:hypothetical protein [Candidatus Woesebacteria bacterium]
MAENKPNMIEQGIRELAKKRGVPKENVRKEMQEDLEKLRQSKISGAKQSADEHRKLIEDDK